MQVSDEAILEAMEPFAAIRGRGTLPNLLAFARVLKMAGLKVSLSQLMDASRSLEFVDIGRREDFQAVLRSNLVSEKEGIATFDRVFDRFWQDWNREERSVAPEASVEQKPGKPETGEGSLEEVIAHVSELGAENKEEDPLPVPAYSPIEAMSRKDFSEMGIEESRAMSHAILLIASKIATQVSRRKRRGGKGDEVDPRWTMRRSIKYGERSSSLSRAGEGSKRRGWCCSVTSVAPST